MNPSISSSNYVDNGGLELVDRYAAVAARRDRARRGPFPHYEREDVVQHVHLDLCALFGPDYPRIVLRAFAHGPGNGGGDDPSALRRAFLAAVARTVGRMRATAAKRRHRGLPREVPLGEGISTSAPDEVGLVALELDTAELFGGLNWLHQRILLGFFAGESTRAIAEAVGRDHRRVAQMLREDVGKVAALLGCPVRKVRAAAGSGWAAVRSARTELVALRPLAGRHLSAAQSQPSGGTDS